MIQHRIVLDDRGHTHSYFVGDCSEATWSCRPFISLLHDLLITRSDSEEPQ